MNRSEVATERNAMPTVAAARGATYNGDNVEMGILET